MTITASEIEEALHLLAETPRRIDTVTQDLDDSRLQAKSDDEPWSTNDILSHLRACADVWGKSIVQMIQQDHPTIRYVSPRTWLKKKNYPTLDFHESFDAFVRQREELLQLLRPLRHEDWARGATFTATTRGREQTVLSYAQRIINHETAHCEQIEGLLK